MAIPIIMPRQGQSVESCIITEFFVKTGDQVKPGDMLFAYETDKAAFEEEASESGEVLAVLYEVGDEVPVLQNVLILGAKGEDISDFSTSNETISNKVEAPVITEIKQQEATTQEIKKSSPTSVAETSGFISPRAKNLAEKHGISTLNIKGSGPHGRVIAQDIEQAVSQTNKVTPLAKAVIKDEGMQAPIQGTGLSGRIKASDLTSENPVYAEDSQLIPIPNIRKRIAEAMHKSLQNSAQLTHHLGADARNILELRNKVKKAQQNGYSHNITLNDMICFSVIKALKQFPRVNSHYLGDNLRQFSKIHLGLAVDTERGLMVPAIKNADDLTIQGLSSQFKQVAEGCKKGNINPDLLNPAGASFTVSNLGNYGVEIFTPVLNLPQVAILGVNTVVPRPKDLGNGAYGFVPYLGLSLTYDHQALDGGEATRFLKTIATEIENLQFEL